MEYIKKISFILTIIGGLNWGLVGFFGLDVVAMILGTMSLLSRIVYILVGFSALYLIFNHTCQSQTIIKKES